MVARSWKQSHVVGTGSTTRKWTSRGSSQMDKGPDPHVANVVQAADQTLANSSRGSSCCPAGQDTWMEVQAGCPLWGHRLHQTEGFRLVGATYGWLEWDFRWRPCGWCTSQAQRAPRRNLRGLFTFGETWSTQAPRRTHSSSRALRWETLT